MIIGIHGRARSGKTTTTEIIKKLTGYSSFAFAKPIKDMLAAVGVDCSDDMKNVVHPIFKKTPRQLMNSLGTDWGRKMNHEDVWVDALHYRANGVEDYVVSDVRTDNEADSVRSRGGVILHITGRGGIDGNYESESGVTFSLSDYAINNGGTIAELEVKVTEFLQELKLI